MHLLKSQLAFILATSLGASGISQAATTIYSTDFPGVENDQPANWTVLAGGTGSSTTNGFYIDDSGDYRYANTSGSTIGLAHYTGTLSNGTAFNELTDYTITTDFSRSSGNVVGLVGRMSSTNTFYHARLLSSGNGNFELYKFVNGTATKLGATVTLSQAFVDDAIWTMSMTFDGTSINAKMFNPIGTEIASITQTDSSIAMGSAGVRVQNTGRYVNYEISVVPEPSSALLITSGLAGLLLRRRR